MGELSKKFIKQLRDGILSDRNVMNSKFNNWKTLILDNLKNRDGNYTQEGFEDLLTYERRHIAEFKTKSNSDNVLFLTHPFYIFLCHQNYLNLKLKNEAKVYLEKLLDLLEKNSGQNKLEIVVLENAQSYGSVTSLLLEFYLVNYVILTP